MEIHLKIVGVLLMGLAFIHVVFPSRFNWKADLAPLSVINREMMYVHTFFVALAVLLMGVLCVHSSYDIAHTNLGRQLSFGLALFWGCRLFCQFFVYSKQLWRGKKFETAVHIIFSIFWTYFTVVFSVITFSQG